MKIVRLTQDEELAAWYHAIARYHAGDVRTPEGNQHPLIGEAQGVFGEFAVAKYFGVDPDTTVYPDRDGPEADLVVDGTTIGIKATPCWVKPHLIVQPYDTNNDRYVLVSVNTLTGHCGIRGWIFGYDLRSYPKKPFKPGSRPSRNAPEEDLTPIEDW